MNNIESSPVENLWGWELGSWSWNLYSCTNPHTLDLSFQLQFTQWLIKISDVGSVRNFRNLKMTQFSQCFLSLLWFLTTAYSGRENIFSIEFFPQSLLQQVKRVGRDGFDVTSTQLYLLDFFSNRILCLVPDWDCCQTGPSHHAFLLEHEGSLSQCFKLSI